MKHPFFFEDDVRTLDRERAREIASVIQTRGFGLFKDQKLTASELVSFMKSVGGCETPDKYMNPKDNPEISLVTGERDKNGNKIGIFGEGALGWHSNGNSRHLVTEILIALYCVVSDPDCTLSLCDTSTPFYDLPEEERAYWRRIKIRLKFQNNTFYDLEEDDPELAFLSQHKGSLRRLVDKHPHTGREYFYFPYHFIVKAWDGSKVIDHLKMIETLKKHIFQSHYQYHFILNEHDLLLMDQLVTLHRRSPARKERLLWRVACDYSKVSEALATDESRVRS